MNKEMKHDPTQDHEFFTHDEYVRKLQEDIEYQEWREQMGWTLNVATILVLVIIICALGSVYLKGVSPEALL